MNKTDDKSQDIYTGVDYAGADDVTVVPVYAVSRKAVEYLLAYYVDDSKYADAIADLRQLPTFLLEERENT